VARIAGLDVAAIVRASIAVADAEGFERLTMRRLSAELGVTPMAIYHHVRDKEELLDLVLDESLRPLPLPDVEGDPLDEIVGWFHAFHELMVDHPGLAQLVADRRLEGPVASVVVSRIMQLALGSGLDETQALNLALSAASLVLGSGIYRTSRAASPGEREHRNRPRDTEAPTELRTLRARLAAVAADDSQFVDGLTLLVSAYLERG
jgi:AcrR family transcriptional regulator